MDQCLPCSTCGCSDENVTKSDLDRFTDVIENVLNDEKGRKLFRNFLITCKMNDARRTLTFWEHTDKLLTEQGNVEVASRWRRYLMDLDRLIEEAENIEELDLATMERLSIVRDSENKEEIVDVLKILKAEATKALRREYNAFRRHYIPKSNTR